MVTSSSRRMRTFKRWMMSQGIDCSDALLLRVTDGDGGDISVSVRAVCELKEGDLVATIPKESCLTVRTTGARDLIDEHGLEGYLALSVALMYELSLGPRSPWFGYLQLLPQSGEPIPLLWSLHDIDSLLSGTELHKTVKEDKALVYEDWKEYILPLLDSAPTKLNHSFFGVDHYFAAKSLIASRSFQIDDHHGFGLVPLADLFNHKTDAEDVHFTSVSSPFENYDDSCGSVKDKTNNDVSGDPFNQNFHSPESHSGGSDISSNFVDNSAVLEMIMVRDVKPGAEVFNTYGFMGNAALLHRYGFTEDDNPYDIVNVDLELVVQWSLSLFSARYSRSRISLWRRLDYFGYENQELEYFEIASDGEPQFELLILLYLILAPEEVYQELDLIVPTAGTGNFEKSKCVLTLSKKESIILAEVSKSSKHLLLTKSVRNALLSLADIRESFYSSISLEEEMEALKRSCPMRERKFYHSMVLRISERRILEKFRNYGSTGCTSYRSCEGGGDSLLNKRKGR